ncbi:MAG: hypothetical protein ABIO44_01390, partial [Saprospiraceae bacterium]
FESRPYQWFNLAIDTSGVYTQRFLENCCGIDSQITFIALPKPIQPKEFHLLCQGNKYVDIVTQQNFTSCEDGKEIFLSKSTDPHLCDSSYLLYLTFLNIGTKQIEYCSGGKLFLETQVIDSTCIVNSYSTLDYDFNWYLKSDFTKASLGTDSIIEIFGKENYCVDITIKGSLNNQTSTCTFTFCENLNEDLLKSNMVCPKGDLEYCKGESGFYSTDTIFPNNVKHIWTVKNGTILTPNPITKSTIEVIWDYDPGLGLPAIGKICYHYESDCPPSPECCIEINVQPYPNPKAGPDKSICGLVNTIDGIFNAGGGTWKQISGPIAVIAQNTSPTPTVTVMSYGKYGFVIAETRFGCTASDTVYLSFFETPTKGITTYICEPDQKSYTQKFTIIKGNPPYKVKKGNGIIDAMNVYTSILIPNNVNDTVTIEDINGCSFDYIQSHECLCSNEIGVISKIIQKVCTDGTINIIYDRTIEKLDLAPNRDTVLFFIYSNVADPLNSILKYINTNSFVYDPIFNFGQIYYIGARLGRADGNGNLDLTKGCLKTSFGTPFIFYEIPKPNAGRDTAICNDNFDLNGFKSINASVVSWREKNGKAVSFINSANSSTNVLALGGFGSYTFILKEDNQNGLCVREDEVNITFNQNPDIQNVDKFCVELGSGMNGGRYKVTADILNGKSPYVLIVPPSTNNGKIIGAKWESDSINSLTFFTIKVRDANGCESQVISDTYNCNCGPINAGQLDTATSKSCVDSCIRIKDLIAETIDPSEDVVMYILHNSSYNNPLSVLDTFYSKNDLICFDPKRMKVGINNPYFITRIVGDDKNPKDSIVDKSDFCAKVSNNMRIVFEPYPMPIAGFDDKVCGLTYKLNGILSFGNPTWRLLSKPNGSNSIFQNSNSIVTDVSVDMIGTYVYILEGKNYNCSKDDTVRISFFDSPEFVDNSIQFICDSVAENYSIIIDSKNGDRPTWNIGGTYLNGTKVLNGILKVNTNTWQSNRIPSGQTFKLNIKDINNCNVDIFDSSFTCNCLTKLGILDTTPIILCSDGCGQTKYMNALGFLDPNDVLRYVLYDGSANNPRNGNFIKTNNTGNFCFDATTMSLGKTYFIA